MSGIGPSRQILQRNKMSAFGGIRTWLECAQIGADETFLNANRHGDKRRAGRSGKVELSHCPYGRRGHREGQGNRSLVQTAVQSYSTGFKARHIQELNDPNGTINMKVHNVFIAVLGPEVQYYSALVRSFDSSLGDMLEGLSILRHVEATADERAAYLKRANAVRRGSNGEGEQNGANGADAEEAEGAIELGEARYVVMSAAEQFVLTISEKGFGKRTSSYEYRTTGRGGKGIVAMAVTEKNGRLVASFPVEESDQIMLVTDGGQLIRCPVDGICIAGRATQGVIVFTTAEGERVASVERLSEEGEENGG